MKLLAISEHYFPRVGGTVNYVHETLLALTKAGVAVELWVPGPAPMDLHSNGIPSPSYAVRWIDAGYPSAGDPTREQRYRFCSIVNEEAQACALSADSPDVLHVVFGLFVMEVLDTDALRSAGLPSVATVHNIPPHECRLVMPEASLVARVKEEVRLQLVGRKNRSRLRKHAYNKYIVPSAQVRDMLQSVLPEKDIDVIGHGPTGDLIACMSIPETRRPRRNAPVRILTVGGYAPHKRQHIIPAVAKHLFDSGLDFQWDVVGPAGRIAGYHDEVVAAVSRAGMQDHIVARTVVPFDELAALYDAANIYVQPSIEEGFCITALDAAASGLPVVASPAGALAQIAEASGGALVDSSPAPLADAILHVVQAGSWPDTKVQGKVIRSQFSWDVAAKALQACYSTIVGK